jgi:two-component system, cell cycle sensor histidine kinase and response regulator CckA
MSESTYRVLIVDDEESIRALVHRVLEEAGYQTMVAANASEAIELFNDHGGCDLLLTDLIMPEVTGDELARRLRLLRPDLKVLYFTGYSETLFSKKSTLWDGEAFLEKPCSITAIKEAVALLLFGRLESGVRAGRRTDRVIGPAHASVI